MRTSFRTLSFFSRSDQDKNLGSSSFIQFLSLEDEKLPGVAGWNGWLLRPMRALSIEANISIKRGLT